MCGTTQGVTGAKKGRAIVMRAVVLVALIGAGLSVAACGSSSGSGATASVSRATANATQQDPASPAATPGPLPPNISLVPKQARGEYVGYQYLASGMNLAKSPYATWTAPKPPWKVCYSVITQQNSWHVEALKMWVMLAKQLQREGYVNGIMTTNSNGDTGLQINQINNMVAQGCNAIEAITPSATALCPAFKNAYDKGVLIISAEGSVDCPGIGQAVQPNDYIDGFQTMQWLAGALKGHGNILMMQGLPSYPLSIARRAGADTALKDYPGIKVLGTLVDQWNAATAKTVLLQWLASHPTTVDGVWQEGCCGDITSQEALKQTGRPPALVNGWGGSAAWLAYWKQHQLNSIDLLQGGPTEAVEYFDVMVRMLAGEKPKVNNLVHTVTFITSSEVNSYYQPWMNPSSTGFVMPPGGGAVPDSYWNPFFTKGTMPVPKFDPTKYDASQG